MTDNSSALPKDRSQATNDGPVYRALGRARGFLARHRPLVGLLCDSLKEAGVEPPEMGLPPLRTVADKPRPVALRVAELLKTDPTAISVIRQVLEIYRDAHGAVVGTERALTEQQAPAAIEDFLARVLPLETFHDALSQHAGLAGLLPTTKAAPVATMPLAAPGGEGAYAPSRELDKLLRVEEGLSRMRSALDKLWMQVKVLQTALDMLHNPALIELSGTSRTQASARTLTKILQENAEEADAVKAFLQEFYAFQVLLQNEKARLARLKRVSRPQAPDLRDVRAYFHKLGLSFHQLNGRAKIRPIFFEVSSERFDEAIPAPQLDLPFRVEEYVARARATLAQLKPRRDILALAYYKYLGQTAPQDPDDPTPSQKRSAEAVAECLAGNAEEARAVAGALERYEGARVELEDFEVRLKAAQAAPADQRLEILAALDLESIREKIDPLAHFGREFKGHPVLGRLFPSPNEVFQSGFKRIGHVSPPRPSEQTPGPKTTNLFEGLIHKIRSATSPLIPPKPPS
jgi:hypothetical protein